MRHARTILILSLAVLATLGAGCKKETATNTTTNTTSPTSTNESAAGLYDGQETRALQLNFKDFAVVFTGYPYVDTAYRPRLFNLVYVDTVYAYNDVVNLTNPSSDWIGTYESSTAENTIFMPIGRSAGDQPIWQTMEIIPTANVETVLGLCTGTPYNLPEELTGTAYDCESTDATAEYAGSDPCFIPVDATRGLLYRQYSSDGSATGSMCDVMKNNHMISIAITE